MTAERVAPAAVALLAAAVMAGCGNDPSTAPKPHVKPQIEYSNVWSADAGVDLFGRPAELVRATTEAGDYTYFVGIDNSYPGFRQAVGGPSSHDDADVSDLLTWETPIRTKQKPTTLFEHITDFTATNSRITATVCSYKIYPDSEFNPTLKPLGEATRVELSNSGDSPGLPGLSDSAPSRPDPRAHRPPEWNVFGTWTIDKLHSLRAEDKPQGCVDWWQRQFPTFSKDSQLNILSAPEGFVPPTQPVAIQYPEWIGPAKPD